MSYLFAFSYYSETEPELYLSVSCGGMGQQWPATGAGALSAADMGYGLSALEGGHHYFTIEPPELTQNWGNRLLVGTNKSCVHQDPGDGSSDPNRD